MDMDGYMSNIKHTHCYVNDWKMRIYHHFKYVMNLTISEEDK